MKERNYGYLIDDDIHVDVALGVVSRFYHSRKLKCVSVEAVYLGETAMLLLVYLLDRSERDVVLNTDILHDVWESRGLIPSYKRLSQVIAEIRGKLSQLGLADDLILTVRGKGYRLRPATIKRLYSGPI